jgi:hypothetical protein
LEEEFFYKYFVGFAYINSDDRVEFGNSKVQLPKKIKSFESAEELQSFLNDQIIPIKGVEKKQLVLLSYQELFE